MQDFIAAARAKKLDRIAAAYAVAGWLLVQAASIAFPTFEAPAWVLRILIAATLVGFPVALFVGWFAIPHPHPDQISVRPGFTPGDGTLLALLGAVVVLSLAQFAYQVWDKARTHSAPPATRMIFSAPSLPTPSQASIAVLPFENLSSDREAGYFAAGIQDEILTRLTKIGALKVISRTSTAHYASRPDNLQEIARELGVANVLEGSVQKIGNAVHINVQLIRAATDDHLWAEVYDRKLDDVFGVESEVATTIADALNAKVTGEERREIAVKPTNNPEAYDSYLRGWSLFVESNDIAVNQRALELVGEAVRLDPKFATAWALLSRIHARRFFTRSETDEERNGARSALDAALRLEPDLAEVRLAQGYYEYAVEQNLYSADRRFEDLYARWPNNAEVLEALGLIARRINQWDRSNAYFAQAVALNPRTPIVREEQSGTLSLTRDFASALRVLDAALDIWPDNLSLNISKAGILQQLGELDRSATILKGVHPEPSDVDAAFAIVTQARYQRRQTEVLGMFERFVQSSRNGGADSDTNGLLEAILGDLRRETGDAAGARALYLHARDIFLTKLKHRPTDMNAIIPLSFIYCGLGNRDAAMETINRAIDHETQLKDQLTISQLEGIAAQLEARFGDGKRAIPTLKRLLAAPGLLTPAVLRLEPDFDKLRGNPQFDVLANRQLGQ